MNFNNIDCHMSAGAANIYAASKTMVRTNQQKMRLHHVQRIRVLQRNQSKIFCWD